MAIARRMWSVGVVGLVGVVVFAETVSAAPEVSSPRGPIPALAQGPTASPTPRPAPAQIPPMMPDSRSSPELTRGSWLWQRTESSDDTTVVPQDPSRYTVAFLPDGRLSIRADCNQVGGSYTQQGAQLTLQLGPSTLIGCPPDSQANPFLDGLRVVATYVFDGENLVLNLRLDGGDMIFAPERAASLTGTAWQLQAYNSGKEAVVSVSGGTEIRAQFGTDGSVSGTAGCNTYRATYTMAGADITITIGPLTTTRRACESPIMEQERAYLAALQAASSYTISGDRLILEDAPGACQAAFVVAKTA